jgi:hypothetical protein
VHQAIQNAVSGVQSTANSVETKVDNIQTKVDNIPPAWSEVLPAADRFKLVMGNAAVLDKETGLVWDRSPDTNARNWFDAHSDYITGVVGVANRRGWRLPRIQELTSLVDSTLGPPGPTLPAGHPFSNVQSSFYWSATSNVSNPTVAWIVWFTHGVAGQGVKSDTKHTINDIFVWCVRGGQGVDSQ